MATDEQLRKLTKFKQPRDRTMRIGELLQEQLARPGVQHAASLAAIRAAIDQMADDLFRKYCRVLAYDGRVLTVRVLDPAVLGTIRRQYLFQLRERLQEALPHVRVRDIRFTVIGD